MKRTLSLLVFGAFLGLSACSSSPAVAASVNGHTISNSTVTTDVSGFAQSSVFRSSLAQQNVHLTKNGPAPTIFTAQWLFSLMQNEAIALIAKQHHVSATAQEKSAARTQFASSQQSGPAFKQLPKDLQTKIVDAEALRTALTSSLKPISNAPALQQAFQALQADCASKKLVGHILVDSPETAQQVIDQIKKGSSFADVAKQVSKHTASAAQGGLLMCEGSSQWSQIPEAFRTAAEATPVGQLSTPVKTDLGYHVIEVLDLTPENAAPLVAATAQPADPLAPVLTKYLKTAKLYVNPRFGKLRLQGGVVDGIDPPTPKATKSRPQTTTSTRAGNTPAPSATSPTTAGQGAGTSSTTTP